MRVDKTNRKTTRRYFIYCNTSRVGKIVCGGVLKAACDSAILTHRSSVTANTRCTVVINKSSHCPVGPFLSATAALIFAQLLLSCRARRSPSARDFPRRIWTVENFCHPLVTWPCVVISLPIRSEMPVCKHGILVSPSLRASKFVCA